jgi:ureidoglycolate dehydrogenase (NAD+)
MDRSQSQNVKAVLADILGPGNEGAILPGQIEANATALSQKLGGLLFTPAEISALAEIAKEANVKFDIASFKIVKL